MATNISIVFLQSEPANRRLAHGERSAGDIVRPEKSRQTNNRGYGLSKKQIFWIDGARLAAGNAAWGADMHGDFLPRRDFYPVAKGQSKHPNGA